MKTSALLLALVLLAGCAAPSARLTFPSHATSRSSNEVWYAMNGDGKPNFGLSYDDHGNVDALLYDDLENGTVSRIYHLSNYSDGDVPHVILLLDSIPFHSMVERYDAGDFRYFGPPCKVIPPFPSLTEICYSSVLHAPPLPGVIDQSYDPKTRAQRTEFWARVEGALQPWDQRCDYRATFLEGGLSFLHPRPWYAAELERARAAIDKSPNRVTIVYIGSAASMVCKYGTPGVEEVLDGADRFCLQLLYERHGAVKISMMSDHGHNLMRSKNLPIAQYLADAGFHPSDTIASPNDVFLEVNGLVTYAGVVTLQPKRVAKVLTSHPEIELAAYLDRDRLIVRDRNGTAAIECRDGLLRYAPIDRDVLEYSSILPRLKRDSDGYATDADWLAATADATFPDGPRRLWDAFHITAVNLPRVMFTTKDGYCAGLARYESFITMESTHAGLNQINSATFLMTMTHQKLDHPLRSRDVLGAIEPGFEPTAKGNP